MLFPRELPRRFLVFQPVPSAGCWQLGGDSGFFECISQNVMPRRTHCLTKTGWSSGCCRTCFWVKSKLSHPHIYLFIWRKLVCILWGKENMMIMFGLESDIVSVIICSLLTDSIPLKNNLACRECWTTRCGCVWKYIVLLRGRCISKLFAFSSHFVLSFWGRFWKSFQFRRWDGLFSNTLIPHWESSACWHSQRSNKNAESWPFHSFWVSDMNSHKTS